jgi:hypothetical protein
MEAGVLTPERWDTIKHAGIWHFKSRMAREVKGQAMVLPYEKSHLVAQSYTDEA